MRYERRETRLENEMGLSRLQMKKIIYEYLVELNLKVASRDSYITIHYL